MYAIYYSNEVIISMRILMQGVIASGLLIVVIAWCIKIRGPLFASVFNPLQLLLVAISAYLLLGEKLYLGRYIINLICFKYIIFHFIIFNLLISICVILFIFFCIQCIWSCVDRMWHICSDLEQEQRN